MILFLMLEMTTGLGDIIIIIEHMAIELVRFLKTFGILLLLFVFVIAEMKRIVKIEKFSIYDISVNVFGALTGRTTFEEFSYPIGRMQLAFIVVLVNVYLISFLIAVFINRLQTLHGNLDAIQRITIIQLKSSIDYDRYCGGVTNTFFPLNIIGLPFFPFVMFFKSERLSEFVLKIQYSCMIFLYCLLGIAFSIPSIPLLYAKCVGNAILKLQNGKK